MNKMTEYWNVKHYESIYSSKATINIQETKI